MHSMIKMACFFGLLLVAACGKRSALDIPEGRAITPEQAQYSSSKRSSENDSFDTAVDEMIREGFRD